MKLIEIRLIQEPDKSFIVYHEKMPFSPWHFHPEYELVYIIKGQGKRMVGDHIDRFKENDLVLLGTYLPHEWLCDSNFYHENGEFKGEAIVVQFLHDFMGDRFIEAPENTELIKVLMHSSQGCKITGQTKRIVISYLDEILEADNSEKLYILFNIFNNLSKSKEYKLLSSPGFTETFKRNESAPLAKAWQYILENFQGDIKVNHLLDITCMSNTTFCLAFKKAYRMTFKEYLTNVRVGYACRLITENSSSIAEIAYESGFENISNFNRQFKKIKGFTPKEFRNKINQ